MLHVRSSRDVARLFRPTLSSAAANCREIFAWVCKRSGRGEMPTVTFSDVTIAMLHAGTISATFDSGAVSHMFRPSGLVVLPPGIPIALAYEDIDCTIIHLKPELLAAPELGNLSRLRLEPQLDPSDIPLTSLIGYVREQLEAGLPDGRMRLRTVGSTIVAHIMAYYAVDAAVESGLRGGLTPRQLRRVMRVMAAAAEDGFSLAELAEAADLSYWYLSHAYKVSTGEAPYQTYQRQRLERAKTLLTKTTMSMTTIAAELRYSSPSHFSTSFKRSVGLPPLAYRRRFGG